MSQTLETVACDFCGGNHDRTVFVRPDGMRVVECLTCRLAFLNPRPRQECLAKFYGPDYSSNHRPGRSYFRRPPADPDPDYQGIKTAEQRLTMVRRFTPLEQQRVLEIGCGGGYFCELASRAGNSVLGLDINPFAVEQAKRRFPRPEFIAADFMDYSHAGEPFDCVCAFEVVEHMAAPRRFFEKVRTTIRAGGLLVLSTPNYAVAGRIGPEKWIGFQMSWEHLYFFTRQKLDHYGKETGFSTAGAFTGGDGSVKRRPSLRALTSRALRRAGLLGCARSVRDAVHDLGAPRHVPVESGHNLLIVYRAE